MQVNSVLHNTDREDRAGTDREITLGTTMILLIFFALAVYGAALFGFGYSQGSKHLSSNPSAIAGVAASSASLNSIKPSPGSPIGAPTATAAVTESAPIPYTPPPATRAVPLPPAPERSVAVDSDAILYTTPRSAAPAPAPAAFAPVEASAPLAGGWMVVQVAAVSHQEDADLIATTLKRQGYAVNVRTEGDRLLHVQVGPFSNRKDAEAMRARLLADGFNAYIK